MVDFLSWFQNNWPNAITAAGVIGSLWIGISAANRESLERMADRHNRLWSQMIEQPGLNRIRQKDIDVLAAPLTAEEEVFINLVMVHFMTSWRFARQGRTVTLKELALDAADFFSRPLPRACWEANKGRKNPEFVRFIERALEADGRLQADD